MKNLRAIALFVWIGFTALARCGWAGEDKDAKGYLTESGQLRHALKLTLTGAKAAAGGTWLVEPSGKWSLADKDGKVSRSGNLSEKQLASLAKDLEDFNLRELPGDIAPRTKTPAQLYTISFGFFSTSFELAGDKSLPKTDPARTDPLALQANRFAAIVRAIQRHLK